MGEFLKMRELGIQKLYKLSFELHFDRIYEEGILLCHEVYPLFDCLIINELYTILL